MNGTLQKKIFIRKKLYHSTARTAENYGIVQKEKNLENTSKELKVRFQYFTRDN